MGVLARGHERWDSGSVLWAFTDRREGQSAAPFDAANLAAHVGDDPAAVAANRAHVAESLGIGQTGLIAMSQVHGSSVVVVNGPEDGNREADALVTSRPGWGLMTQVADCVPILVGSPHLVAAVHAGWRGVVAEVVPAAVEQMLAAGAEPPRMRAWVGPAICPGCYEVGEDVREQVTAVAPAAFAVTRAGTPAVDVRAAVVEQLSRLGIATELVGGCTFEDPTLFSFRRDQVTGRQAGIIVLQEP